MALGRRGYRRTAGTDFTAAVGVFHRHACGRLDCQGSGCKQAFSRRRLPFGSDGHHLLTAFQSLPIMIDLVADHLVYHIDNPFLVPLNIGLVD